MIRKLLCISALTASCASFAGGKHMDDFLTRELGLDEVHAEQVKAIMKEAKEARKAHKEAVKNKLAQVMTEEELAKFEERRHHKKDHGHCKDKKLKKGDRVKSQDKASERKQ